jgi:hypothetical protein
MQNAKGEWLRRAVVLHLHFLLPQRAEAQIGRQIAEIVIEQEGRPVTDPVITGLIETTLDHHWMHERCGTISHLMSFNRFDDVQC